MGPFRGHPPEILVGVGRRDGRDEDLPLPRVDLGRLEQHLEVGRDALGVGAGDAAGPRCERIQAAAGPRFAVRQAGGVERDAPLRREPGHVVVVETNQRAAGVEQDRVEGIGEQRRLDSTAAGHLAASHA